MRADARHISLQSPYYSKTNQPELCATIIFGEAFIQSHKAPIAIPFATFFLDVMDTMDLLDNKENQGTLVMIIRKSFMRTFHFTKRSDAHPMPEVRGYPQ